MAGVLTGTIEALIQDAKSTSEQLYKKGMKPTQLRKVHSYVTKLWMRYTTFCAGKSDSEERKEVFNEILDEVKYLQVFLAYQYGRAISGYDLLNEKLTSIVNEVKDEETFSRLKKYVDALAAYAKYNEKLEKNNSKNSKNFNK